MKAHSRVAPIPWAALFFALLGLVWCGYVAFPTAQPPACSSSGCHLFRDGKIAGVSLWWVGGAYFFCLAIACLREARQLAWNMARAALFLDGVLLIVMFFTAPCLDCIIAALFFGLTYFCLRPAPDDWFLDASPLLLLPLWLGLFLGNACLTINEMAPLMTVGPSGNPNVRIYFSPSCPPCRDAVNAYGENAILIPVREREGDIASIIRLKTFLDDGIPLREALARSIAPGDNPPPISISEYLLATVQLLRNKAMVLRHGFISLPLIQVNGMPSKGASAREMPRRPAPAPEAESPVSTPRPGTTPPADALPSLVEPQRNGSVAPSRAEPLPPPDENPLPDFLEDLSKLEQCSQASGKPCPE